MHALTSKRSGAAALLLLLAFSGACVQRNVERIDREEAAQFASPPPPAASTGVSSNQPTIAATRITGTIET